MTKGKLQDKTTINKAFDAGGFRLIKGGLNSSVKDARRTFLSGYATDTRLMGVLVLYGHWEIEGGADLHQFFYIDCEEAGLETCTCLRGEFGDEARLTEQKYVGGLGAKKIPVDEASFLWLIQHWRDFNVARGLPLPKKQELYDFVFENEVELGSREQHELMTKICGIMISDFQVVNYFLMRCFGQDYEGVMYLAEGNFPVDLYDSYRKATFSKNTIDRSHKYKDGSVSYMCESLVEMNGEYEIITSKVVVKDLRVIGFEHCDRFPVTAVEAALILKKPEFVSVYEVLINEDQLEENLGEFILTSNTIMSTHETGRMFMAYKTTNDHVSEPVFMLSNDVRGVYYLTDYGQLILMANSHSDIVALELALAKGPLHAGLVATGRYEFLEPVLFEFIESGFDDFDEFLRAISDEV